MVSVDYYCVWLIYLNCLLNLYKDKRKISMIGHIYIYIYIYINLLFFQRIHILFFFFFSFLFVTNVYYLPPPWSHPQGTPPSNWEIDRLVILFQPLNGYQSSRRFLIAKVLQFKQEASCLFLFMYAIGEMHQVISETYTLIWAAKQKDWYPINK